MQAFMGAIHRFSKKTQVFVRNNLDSSASNAEFMWIKENLCSKSLGAWIRSKSKKEERGLLAKNDVQLASRSIETA